MTPRVVIALDVDGTISRIYRNDESPEHSDWRAYLPIDDEVIDALDAQARRPGVQVAWLTSWDEKNVRWLIETPLRGRLEGDYIEHRGHARGWRIRALVDYLDSVGADAVVWADDNPGRGTRGMPLTAAGYSKLLIRPDLHVGVSLADVARIAAFIDSHQTTSPLRPGS